jgi:hypothetical protein
MLVVRAWCPVIVHCSVASETRTRFSIFTNRLCKVFCGALASSIAVVAATRHELAYARFAWRRTSRYTAARITRPLTMYWKE